MLSPWQSSLARTLELWCFHHGKAPHEEHLECWLFWPLQRSPAAISRREKNSKNQYINRNKDFLEFGMRPDLTHGLALANALGMMLEIMNGSCVWLGL